MTPAELKEQANQIFEMSLEEMKKNGEIPPGFWIITPTDGLQFNPYGSTANMLNSGAGKEILFAITRIFVEKSGATAFFLVTETWQFEGNEKSKELTEEDWQTKVDRGFRRLEAEGYGKTYQSLMVEAMTPEWHYMTTRKFEDIILNGKRKIIFHGEPGVSEGPLDKFRGRVKMFGPFTEPCVEKAYNLMKATATGQKDLADFNGKEEKTDTMGA